MKKKKIQILFIHGGMTFPNKRDYLKFLKTRDVSIVSKPKWNGADLDKRLGKRFQVIRPRMPLQDYATYSEWAMHFEKFFPLLTNGVILVGESLGGIFLAKYLSENKFPKKILATYLVCPPFDDTLPGEDLAGGFKLKSDLSLLEKNSLKLRLLFAKHDPVVPVAHAKKFAKKLPNATIKIYPHINGHFQVPKFPEIADMIKQDTRAL